MDQQSYFEQFQQLLPPGKAWTRHPDANLSKILKGLSEEPARLDVLVRTLFDEADPRTATALLGEWERLLGLPDDCASIPVTDADRRKQIHARLLGHESPTEQFFISLAAAFGYAITISISLPISECGVMECGDELIPDSQRFIWEVSGVSAPLDDTLICLFEKLAPAHTVVYFTLT